MWARKMIVALLVGFALGCAVSWLAGGNTNSSIIPLASTVPQEYPLNFLVLGDWGRKGEYNQTEVAKQVRQVHRDFFKLRAASIVPARRLNLWKWWLDG